MKRKLEIFVDGKWCNNEKEGCKFSSSSALGGGLCWLFHAGSSPPRLESEPIPPNGKRKAGYSTRMLRHAQCLKFFGE